MPAVHQFPKLSVVSHSWTHLLQTAVNFHGRKNKMGTYCPPLAVFIDNAFLASLEQRHLSNGSAEILKMACIKDAALFELLEEHAAELLRTNFQVGHWYTHETWAPTTSPAVSASYP